MATLNDELVNYDLDNELFLNEKSITDFDNELFLNDDSGMEFTKNRLDVKVIFFEIIKCIYKVFLVIFIIGFFLSPIIIGVLCLILIISNQHIFTNVAYITLIIISVLIIVLPFVISLIIFFIKFNQTRIIEMYRRSINL